MWPRIGAALAFLCVLCTTASAQMSVQSDSVVRVRKDRPVLPEVRLPTAAAPRLLGTPVAAAPPVTPDTPLLGTPLLVVFDTAQDPETWRVILAAARDLPDTLQRELILRGVQLSGDRAASYVAGLSVLTALRLGEKGRAILRDALRAGVVRDRRLRSLIDASVRGR